MRLSIDGTVGMDKDVKSVVADLMLMAGCMERDAKALRDLARQIQEPVRLSYAGSYVAVEVFEGEAPAIKESSVLDSYGKYLLLVTKGHVELFDLPKWRKNAGDVEVIRRLRNALASAHEDSLEKLLENVYGWRMLSESERLDALMLISEKRAEDEA